MDERFQQIVLGAFLYFYHLDRSNAEIHRGKVRYSPLTFELCEILEAFGYGGYPAVKEVIYDRGQYSLDLGR